MQSLCFIKGLKPFEIGFLKTRRNQIDIKMLLWNLIARIFRLPPTSKMHERALYAFLSKEDVADFNSIDPSGWCPIQRAIENSNS